MTAEGLTVELIVYSAIYANTSRLSQNLPYTEWTPLVSLPFLPQYPYSSYSSLCIFFGTENEYSSNNKSLLLVLRQGRIRCCSLSEFKELEEVWIHRIYSIKCGP